MNDYELSRFYENYPDCDCNCMKCPAFACNMREELGYNENDEEYQD